jgi:hypothetical protein
VISLDSQNVFWEGKQKGLYFAMSFSWGTHLNRLEKS